MDTNNKLREIIEQLIACHDEPDCPAVAVAKEFLAADDTARGTMPAAYETVESSIVGRYRVVKRNGGGFWPYCVQAGDGTMELFIGHKTQCEKVAAALQTACLDGAFMASLAATRAAALPCGHPTSLMLHSAETGEPLYCELCDDKSGRADAADLDDMLIMRFLNPRSEGETLRQCINRIIDWDVMVNLDPAVSSAAQALVDQGRKRPEAEVADWRIEYDNDAGPDGGFHEWWDVTDGERTFRCDAKDEAEWLLERLVRGEKP